MADEGKVTSPEIKCDQAGGAKSIFQFPEGSIGVDIPLVSTPKPIGKYFNLNSVTFKLGFKGAFESAAGPVSIQPTWGTSWGLAVKGGSKYNWTVDNISLVGEWQLSTEASASPPEVKLGAQGTLSVKLSEADTLGPQITIEVVPIGLSKKASGEWEGEIAEIVGTGSVVFASEIETESPKGSWKGSITAGVEAKVGPNWTNILTDALKETLEKAAQAAAESLSEAAVETIAGVSQAALPFAVAGVIIYAFWEESKDMQEQRDLITGTTTNEAVELFTAGFAAGLKQPQTTDVSTAGIPQDGASKEGFTHGQEVWKSAYAKYKASASVTAWIQQAPTAYPDYGNDQGWIDDQCTTAFQSSMNDKVESLSSAAGEQARPEIKHQLFLAWAKEHNYNTVDCLPVLVNLYPRGSNYTWAPGTLPQDLSDMATKYGWIAASDVKKKPAATPSTQTTTSPLGQKLEDHATAKANLLAWAKNNVMVHADGYRTMYRNSADLKVLTDEDLQDVDQEAHPDPLGGN